MQPLVEDLSAMCTPSSVLLSATPAMTKHGMDVESLNSGQIPVTTFDQPLFSQAKFVQWKWPDTHCECGQVVMLGGLHTEMALWNALTEAEVADSLVWLTHI